MHGRHGQRIGVRGGQILSAVRLAIRRRPDRTVPAALAAVLPLSPPTAPLAAARHERCIAPRMPSARRQDNDQHYKTLFRTFLRELLEVTHPDLVPRLRFDRARFLDKETYTDLLHGKGFRLDLVCELPCIVGARSLGGRRLVLLHTEIEEGEPKARRGVPFAQRMAEYVMTLWLRHRIPIIPLVVTFFKGGRGLSTEVFRIAPLDEEVLTLRYRQFGVAGVSAARFLRAGNPLGWALAIRMLRGGRSRVDLQLACERRILHADLDESKQLLLLDSVKTYARLSPIEQRQYDERLNERQNRALKEATMTWLEKAERRGELRGERRGEQRGELRGEQRGERKRLLWSIERSFAQRFGAMPDPIRARLDAITEVATLEAAFEAILGAQEQSDALARLAAL